MPKAVSVRMIRDEARQTAKRSINEAQKKYRIWLTPAAKRFILRSIAITLGENSEDLTRIGSMEKGPIRATKGRFCEVRLSPKIDVSKATQTAIVKVFDQATTEHKEKMLFTVADMEAAIKAKWCGIFPICGKSTGKKMGLEVKSGDLK
jgi:hypothetical protein